MSSAPTRTDNDAPLTPSHDGYRHDAYFYSGLDGFLAATVPFLCEGIAAGQPTMAVVAPPRLDALRAALGAGASEVCLLDMAEVGRNPARILPTWLGFLDEHRGQPVRGVGEPVWSGRSPEELVECQLHEALLNVAVSPDTPLWLRCPYDREQLDPSVVAEAHRSHPVVVDERSYSGSTSYGGLSHVTTLFESDLPQPSAPPAEVRFGRDDLDTVRLSVQAMALDAGLPVERVEDVTTAVFELATNSVKHAGGKGMVRSWADPGCVVFEVQDDGHIEDPLVGRRMPPLEATGGRGVWLANQLVDLVQLRSTPSGTTVRLTTWR
jgi:anti-sigma regulatory factor (Ser/Thr protein kinase)